MTLDRSDIVRHPLVQAIVNAYEETEPVRRAGVRSRARRPGPTANSPTGPPASE